MGAGIAFLKVIQNPNVIKQAQSFPQKQNQNVWFIKTFEMTGQISSKK